MYLEMRWNTAKIEGEKLRPGMPSSRVAITTLHVKMEWRGDVGRGGGVDIDRYAIAASR